MIHEKNETSIITTFSELNYIAQGDQLIQLLIHVISRDRGVRMCWKNGHASMERTRQSRERPISKKQQWAGGRELWPGDPECVGCARDLTKRGGGGGRGQRTGEGGGLSPLTMQRMESIPVSPTSPTEPPLPTSTALRCSPSSFEQTAGRPAKPTDRVSGAREEVEEIKAGLLPLPRLVSANSHGNAPAAPSPPFGKRPVLSGLSLVRSRHQHVICLMHIL